MLLEITHLSVDIEMQGRIILILLTNEATSKTLLKEHFISPGLRISKLADTGLYLELVTFC